MNIKVTEEKDVVVLEIEGEVDLYNAPELREILKGFMDKDKLDILIDLNKVDYIDSSGIGVLISLATDLKDMHGSLVLKSPSPNVLRVFELTQLVNFFTIIDDEEKLEDKG